MGLELFLEGIAVMPAASSCSSVWKIGSMFFLREEALWELVTFKVTYPCALALPPGIVQTDVLAVHHFGRLLLLGTDKAKQSTKQQICNSLCSKKP